MMQAFKYRNRQEKSLAPPPVPQLFKCATIMIQFLYFKIFISFPPDPEHLFDAFQCYGDILDSVAALELLQN